MRITLLLGISVLSTILAGCAADDGEPSDDGIGGDESEVVQRAPIPEFQKMWDAYPHGTAEEVKNTIGGAVDADWITNTCTIRMSRALNYAGFTVPSGPRSEAKGFHTVRGADKKNYGYRVAEFRTFLLAKFGPPSIEKKIPAGAPVGIDKSEFAGKKGIILYEVPGWSDATGHADLWNGSAPAHDEYFSQAARVQLWEAP